MISKSENLDKFCCSNGSKMDQGNCCNLSRKAVWQNKIMNLKNRKILRYWITSGSRNFQASTTC